MNPGTPGPAAIVGAKSPAPVRNHLVYLQPTETFHALRSLNLDAPATIRADNQTNRIVASFTRKEDGMLTADLLERIDIPHVDPPSRFFGLPFIDAGNASEALSPPLPDRDTSFTIIPDTHTNRIFLMGTIGQLKQASKLLAEPDEREVF